jgi:hypothetical protein
LLIVVVVFTYGWMDAQSKEGVHKKSLSMEGGFLSTFSFFALGNGVPAKGFQEEGG